MAQKFSKQQIETWRKDCQAWLDGFNAEKGTDWTLDSFDQSSEAHLIMRRAGVQEAVYLAGGFDGHLKTVGQQIFPNVVFKDKKRY